MKNKFKILILFIIFIPCIAYASGSISLSKYNVTLNPGNQTQIKISASNATGVFKISSSNSNVASVDISQDWIDNETKIFNIKANSVGTATIIVSINGSDYDENEIITTYKIVVYVNNPTTTTTTTTTVVETTNKQTQSKTKTTTKKTTEIVKREEIPEPVTEPVTEEVTTTQIVKDLTLKNIKIVGYDLKFKENQTNYKLIIPEDLKEIYIITEKDENVAFNDGIYNIEGKKEILLKVEDKNTLQTKEYKIEFIRKKYSEIKKRNNSLIYTLLIILAFIIIIVLTIIISKKMINNSKQKTIIPEQNEDELKFRNDYFE